MFQQKFSFFFISLVAASIYEQLKLLFSIELQALYVTIYFHLHCRYSFWFE